MTVIGLGYTYYPDLVPHDRLTYSAADRFGFVAVPDGSLQLTGGYLDAAGNTDAGEGFSCSIDGVGADTDEFRAHWQACLDRAGIVARYTDYLDASRRPQLTLVLSGICAVLAAAGLVLGWWRVRRRIL